MQERCCGKEKGGRALAGGPWERAIQVCINWRSRWQHSWWCWEPREACQLSTDYWEEPGATWAMDFYFFPWDMVPWTGQRWEGRTLCVCGYFKGLWDFNEDIKSLLLSLYNLWINNSFPFHQSLTSGHFLEASEVNLVQGNSGRRRGVHSVIVFCLSSLRSIL